MIPPQLMPPAEHAATAQAILSNARGIHEYLDACEACGLPVQQQRDELNTYTEFAQSFLRNFFPDQLPT